MVLTSPRRGHATARSLVHRRGSPVKPPATARGGGASSPTKTAAATTTAAALRQHQSYQVHSGAAAVATPREHGAAAHSQTGLSGGGFTSSALATTAVPAPALAGLLDACASGGDASSAALTTAGPDAAITTTTIDNNNINSANTAAPSETWLVMELCDGGSLAAAAARGEFVRRPAVAPARQQQPEAAGVTGTDGPQLDMVSGTRASTSDSVWYGDRWRASTTCDTGMLKGLSDAVPAGQCTSHVRRWACWLWHATLPAACHTCMPR